MEERKYEKEKKKQVNKIGKGRKNSICNTIYETVNILEKFREEVRGKMWENCGRRSVRLAFSNVRNI
jgi:hypothetical protein